VEYTSVKQGAGNREQGIGNREQGTGNREQGIGSREEGPRGQGNEKLEGELVLSPVPKGEGPGAPALFSKNQFVRAV
jgi:hypothetical protein